MEHSENIAKLAQAMVKAQAAIGPAIKNSVNPHFKSKFADLAACWAAAEEVLPKHGLCVLQGSESIGGKMHLWTMLLHETGEWVKGTQEMLLQKQDPQGIGSAYTYLRRYGLAAMLGLVQEDDDGNAASKEREIPKPLAAKAADDKELLDWLAAIEGAGSVEELETMWPKIPQRLQNACLKAAKDKKAKLTQGAH